MGYSILLNIIFFILAYIGFTLSIVHASYRLFYIYQNKIKFVIIILKIQYLIRLY